MSCSSIPPKKIEFGRLCTVNLEAELSDEGRSAIGLQALDQSAVVRLGAWCKGGSGWRVWCGLSLPSSIVALVAPLRTSDARVAPVAFPFALSTRLTSQAGTLPFRRIHHINCRWRREKKE